MDLGNVIPVLLVFSTLFYWIFFQNLQLLAKAKRTYDARHYSRIWTLAATHSSQKIAIWF